MTLLYLAPKSKEKNHCRCLEIRLFTDVYIIRFYTPAPPRNDIDYDSYNLFYINNILYVSYLYAVILNYAEGTTAADCRFIKLLVEIEIN